MAGNIGSPLCAELNRIANNGVYPDRDDFLEEQGAANVWAGTTGQGLLGALNYIVDPSRTENNFSDLTKVCNELAGTTGLSDVDALRTINHPAEVLLRGTTPQSAVFTTDAATPRYNYPGYVYLPGVSGNYISIPDENALDITGNIDIRAKVALDTWIPAQNNVIVAKWTVSKSFIFNVRVDGKLELYWSADGTATTNAIASTVAVLATAGSALWVRTTLTVNNGSSQNEVRFFTSTDGTTWTQLGTTVTNAGATSIFAGTSVVEIGTQANTGTWALAGKVYNAQIFASNNGTDKRLDVDLTTNVTSATYDQFTATTGQLCTINGQNTLTNMGKAGSLLPVTVGSSLAADSNDAKFLDHTGTNYVYLPGVTSNFISVPDAAALDITGDIDLRWYGALDDWTPASNGRFITKYNGVDGNYSFAFGIATNGGLTLGISPNGTIASATTATSSAVLTVADGTPLWTRATWRQSDGRVQFFTSTDGTTWTQFGTNQTNSSASIFASVSNIEIGSANAGTGNLGATGKHFRAQIFNGIDGTKVLDVDTSVITTGAATSFTAVTGQTVTINRSTSGRKTVAVTQPTWLFGTDDYMEVNNRYMAHSTSDENYVYLSGATGNYMSVADNPPLDVTGDIDIQVKVAMDDWTPSAINLFMAKRPNGASQQSYFFYLNTDGTISIGWTPDGTTVITKGSSVATGVADGATKWVRATLDVDNGASGNDVKFFTSDDGITWTQLGTTRTTAGVTSIYSGTGILEIGSQFTGSSNNLKGKFYRAIIKNGIDGTTVLDANAAVITLPSQTTFTDSSSNAYTVTINKSGVGTFVSTGNYLYLPGVSTNYASVPDSAALDITGDIDIRVKVAMDDWTPSTQSGLLAKSDVAADAYLFYIVAGVLQFFWVNAAGASTIVSSAGITIPDGTTKWVRVTLDVDNGAAGNTATFYTSDDGITWTALGSPVVNAGVTNIRATTAPVNIGAQRAASNFSRGKFFRAQVYNGINGTLALDANFEGSITSLNQASFTESSSNAATVTINRSGSAYRSAGVIDAGYLYPGATNTFANSTIDYLNFGATDSFTALVVSRQANYSATQVLMMKGLGLSSPGYFLRNSTGTPANLAGGFNDPTIQIGLSGGSRANLGLVTASVVRNTSTDNGIIYTNATAGTAGTDTTTASLATVTSLVIGSTGAIGNYADMELYAAAVFRQVLTAAQIRQITNYFANREVYL